MYVVSMHRPIMFARFPNMYTEEARRESARQRKIAKYIDSYYNDERNTRTNQR